MAEAENSRREAFEEALRRGKAEKDAIESIRRVNFWAFSIKHPHFLLCSLLWLFLPIKICLLSYFEIIEHRYLVMKEGSS